MKLFGFFYINNFFLINGIIPIMIKINSNTMH